MCRGVVAVVSRKKLADVQPEKAGPEATPKPNMQQTADSSPRINYREFKAVSYGCSSLMRFPCSVRLAGVFCTMAMICLCVLAAGLSGESVDVPDAKLVLVVRAGYKVCAVTGSCTIVLAESALQHLVQVFSPQRHGRQIKMSCMRSLGIRSYLLCSARSPGYSRTLRNSRPWDSCGSGRRVSHPKNRIQIRRGKLAAVTAAAAVVAAAVVAAAAVAQKKAYPAVAAAVAAASLRALRPHGAPWGPPRGPP